MDLVINHCSDKHEWFQKALADPDGEYADYFYFRKGKKRLTRQATIVLTSAAAAGNRFREQTNTISICSPKNSLI